MAKAKKSEETCKGSTISFPISMRQRIDRYLAAQAAKGRTDITISSYTQELWKSVLEEWEKEKQITEALEPANKDTFRSPLGTAMSTLDPIYNGNDVKAQEDNKPEHNVLENMYLTPLEKIIRTNKDDPNYLLGIQGRLDRELQLVKSFVFTANASAKQLQRDGRRKKELEEARRKTHELHPDIFKKETNK